MNLVGKIFTVLIFLMCVVFGTFALMVHAAHKNWKVETVDLNQKLTDANKEKLALLEEQKNLQTALNDEKARTQRRLIALEQAKNEAIEERNKNENRIQLVEADARKLAQVIEGASKHLAVLQIAIDGMRDNYKLTVDERNKLQKALVDTNDKLMNAVAEQVRLDKLGRELAAQIIKLKELMAYAKVTPNDMLKTPPEGTVGEVTAVPRPDVVEISLGADDGIRKGHKFVVTRPSTGKYIGMIEVIRADDGNRAVCRPDKASQSDQIQKGDRVTAYTKPR